MGSGLTPQHQQMRLRFCRLVRDFTILDWRRAIFVDESFINMLLGGGARVLRPRGARYNQQYMIQEPNFHRAVGHMVFGGIGYNCKLDLRRLDGGVTGERYARLLSYQVLPEIIRKKGQNFVFIQDNAPPHRSVRAQAALNRRNIELLEFWPPNSYDLNPIENVWGILKARIRARNPQDRNELWAIAREEWEAIPQETINECINSMPERILAVLRARGGRTRY